MAIPREVQGLLSRRKPIRSVMSLREIEARLRSWGITMDRKQLSVLIFAFRDDPEILDGFKDQADLQRDVYTLLSWD